jgi:beta-lysine 5,6-aminomutase alpha subunit
LQEISEISLFTALEKGLFADIKRHFTGGKGLSGVFEKDIDYSNPALEYLEEKIHEN